MDAARRAGTIAATHAAATRATTGAGDKTGAGDRQVPVTDGKFTVIMYW
jgi:hypothetical protein